MFRVAYKRRENVVATAREFVAQRDAECYYVIVTQNYSDLEYCRLEDNVGLRKMSVGMKEWTRPLAD